MNALQLQRMELQRVTLEAKLKALQARVEPRFLIDVLSRIDRLYDGDAARGHRALDELITYLRAALPQLRDRSSTLEQELRLACAHLQLAHGCADDGGPRIETTIDDGLGQAHLPPMLLWPLLDLALGSAPSGLERSLSIAAHATSGRLRLEIRARGLAAPRVRALPQDLEERLHALYGARAALAFDAQRGDIVLEIPHETSDRADR
jgi:LytS/YehU family sensor histidine kinase